MGTQYPHYPLTGTPPHIPVDSLAALLTAPRPFFIGLIHEALATWQPAPAPAALLSTDPDELLDVAAAAVLLGVVKATIHDYVKRGVLFPHRMRPGGKLYFYRDEVLKALTASTRQDGQRKHMRRANKKGQ